MKFLRTLFSTGPDVRGWVARVAAKEREEHGFRQLAKAAADELQPSSIPGLRELFHEPPPMPPDVAVQFTRYGAWMAACQCAIFEILYNFREASLPLVREVAFGVYDWTQANAIDILGRFGIDGIEREKIAGELAFALPKLRYEAVLYSINSLTRFAPYAPPLMEALDRMIVEWSEDDPIETLELLEPLSRNAPEQARKYEPVLRSILTDTGRGVRDPLADGQVVETEDSEGNTAVVAASGPTYSSIADLHAIRATLILKGLFPEDIEIRRRLEDWASSHPDESVRAELSEELQAEQEAP